MNHKELVKSIICRESGIHVAFDIFEGWMWPVMTKKLMEYFAVDQSDELLEKMGASCRWVTPFYCGPTLPASVKERVASLHTTHSLNSAIWKFLPGIKGYELSDLKYPLADVHSPDDLDVFPWPSPKWFDFDGMAYIAHQYHEDFVIAGGFSPLFFLLGELFGMERALINLIQNPQITEEMIGLIFRFYADYYSSIAHAGHDCIDAMAFGDDFSNQVSLLMSPETWRYYFKPAWKALFQLAHEAGYLVFFHSCGAVALVIPDLIEIGVDVLYPIQPLASGMDIVALKECFGNKLTFYGGLDVQQLLPYGTPGEIENEVSRLIKLFQDSGGLILSTSHVVMEDIPFYNVLAMLKGCSVL